MLSTGWSGRYGSSSEVIKQEDSVGLHSSNSSIIEIDQPGNKCIIFGYPSPDIYFPINANNIEAVKFYDSIIGESIFDIKVTPVILKSLKELYKSKYNTDLDLSQQPFVIADDTVARLALTEIRDSTEIIYYHGGVHAWLYCLIVYEKNDSVEHTVSGGVDLTNSKYLGKTLPAYCFFQEYPDLFFEFNELTNFKESDIADVIFRFIRWKKEEDDEKRDN